MKHKIYSGQTGQFPTRSRRGNGYIMVTVEIDSNYTLVEPMKNRTDTVMIDTYRALLKRLKRAGVTTTKHVLDNECSTRLKKLIQDTYKLELVSPGCHRRNIAEVAIKAFKQHFLGILAGRPDNFLWLLWDRLLPQTETTLNLLRQSNAIPTVSEYAHMYGNFDYNRMPLAPMGCPCRGKWDFHMMKGYYLFTSDDHYRTHNMFMKDTKAEQLSGTVMFMHGQITSPTITHADKLINVMARLAKTVERMTGRNTKLAKKNGVNMKDLTILAETTAYCRRLP